MKHNIHRLVILCAIMMAATGAKAQIVDKLHAEDGLFNHLSVGLNYGTTGANVDVAMPVHEPVLADGLWATSSSKPPIRLRKSPRCRWWKRMPSGVPRW